MIPTMPGCQKVPKRRLLGFPFLTTFYCKFGVLLLFAKLHPCEIPGLILFCLFVFHFTETQPNLIPLESKEMIDPKTQKEWKNEKIECCPWKWNSQRKRKFLNRPFLIHFTPLAPNISRAQFNFSYQATTELYFL